MSPPLLLFDGDCRFCNAWVRFVVRHEVAPSVYFVPLQSAYAAQLLAPYHIDPARLDSVYLITAKGLRAKSDAALGLAAGLRWPWRALGALRILPRALRDAAYDLIGRWRYRLFGRSAYCAARDPGSTIPA